MEARGNGWEGEGEKIDRRERGRGEELRKGEKERGRGEELRKGEAHRKGEELEGKKREMEG